MGTTLSRRAALAAPAALALSVPAVAGAHPDAALIAACADYIEAMRVYDRDGGHLEYEVCPLWRATERAAERAAGMRAKTMRGVRAMAEVAEYQARQQDGRKNYDTSFTGEWPGRVIESLLAVTAD